MCRSTCGSGYGNAPTKRGGSDGKGKGSDNCPTRHERPRVKYEEKNVDRTSAALSVSDKCRSTCGSW
eukprot:scaffold39537_cov51-Phaeocystis_antarctica.AAC.4